MDQVSEINIIIMCDTIAHTIAYLNHIKSALVVIFHILLGYGLLYTSTLIW